MLTVVCCDRGAPGATTTALLLASLWPTDDEGSGAVLVEADPYGGDLALRCRSLSGGHLRDKTVLSLATAARTATSPELVAEHAQPVAGGLLAVPGHLSAEQGASVPGWTPLAKALTASRLPVVADVGRVHAVSPSIPLAAAADVLVAVARPDLAAMIHLRERLTRLVPVLAKTHGRPPVVVPLVLAPRRIGAQVAAQAAEILLESSASTAIAAIGWIAWSPDEVAVLEAKGPAGLGRRSALLQSGRAAVDLVFGSAGGGLRDQSPRPDVVVAR